MTAPDSLDVELPDEAATLALGRIIAACLPDRPPYPALLLTGDLGAGKTTLTRGLVEALPGGEQAEVSSPSFNIVNLYPTTPEVAHFDLYRLAGGRLDDDVAERLEDPAALSIVEWAALLRRDEAPADALALAWEGASAAAAGRRLRLTASGEASRKLLAGIERRLRRRGDVFEPM